MVLPAPPAHDELPPGEAGWVEQIRLSVRLARTRGILVLVDHAVPERLGDLVRGLVGEFPDVDVLSELAPLEDAPEGAVLVLIPRPSYADALNMGRPLFARRKLKVVLWCDQETTVALRDQAPDFYSWVSEYHECPPGPVPHAVAGLRAAVAAKAPGIAWRGSGDHEDKARLLTAFEAAFPGETLTWIDARRDYQGLFESVSKAKEAWIACRAQAFSHVRRIRWAMADVGKRGRAIIVTDHYPCPGWWPVHGRLAPFDEARSSLGAAGYQRPGAVAALTGLEPEAIDLAKTLSNCAVQPRTILEWMRSATDPGATLEQNAYSLGLVQFEKDDGSTPNLRTLTLRALPLTASRLHVELDDVERNLPMAPKSTSRCAMLIHAALEHDELDVAEVWTLRVAHAGTSKIDPVRHAVGRLLNMERTNLRLKVIRFVMALDGRLTRAMASLLFHVIDRRIVDPMVRGLLDTRRWLLKQRRQRLKLGQYRDATRARDPELLAEGRDPTLIEREMVALYLTALAEQGEYTRAAPLVYRSVALEGRIVGVERPSFIAVVLILVFVLVHTGRAADAEVLTHKLLGPDAALPGQDAPPHHLAPSGNAEADEYLDLFLALPKIPPLSTEARAEALRHLAEAWITQGRYDEAEDLLRRVVEHPDANLPDDHPERWRTLTTYGRVLLFQRHPAEAEPVLRRALALAEKHAGKHHPDTARVLAALARVEHALGRSEAPSTAQRALALFADAQLTDTVKALARSELEPIAAP